MKMGRLFSSAYRLKKKQENTLITYCISMLLHQQSLSCLTFHTIIIHQQCAHRVISIVFNKLCFIQHSKNLYFYFNYFFFISILTFKNYQSSKQCQSNLLYLFSSTFVAKYKRKLNYIQFSCSNFAIQSMETLKKSNTNHFSFIVTKNIPSLFLFQTMNIIQF